MVGLNAPTVWLDRLATSIENRIEGHLICKPVWKDIYVKHTSRLFWTRLSAHFCLACLVAAADSRALLAAEDTAVVAKASNSAAAEAAIEQRLEEAIGYLASDELEGRGLATKGINTAAEYLAEQFRDLGLKTDLYDGTPFQTFQTTISSKLGPAENNHARVVSPRENGKSVEWKLGRDFQPLGVGGSATFELPLVFVGYGISVKQGKDEDFAYDDYEDVDVKGKAVIILRHEPQQLDPHSPFDGTARLALCADCTQDFECVSARGRGGDIGDRRSGGPQEGG